MTFRSLAVLLAAIAALIIPATLVSAADIGSSADQMLPSRQILVMLKTPPEHLRPGSAYSGGGYGDVASLAARKRVAEAIARKNGFAIVDGWPMPLLGVDCYAMRLAPGQSVEAAIAAVSRDPRVAWSEPMQLYQAQGSETVHVPDPLLPVEPAAVKWRLADLHRFASGAGVSVAIIDSKVDVRHPDLAGHFVADENFLSTDAAHPEQHGTAVAGIIGAGAGNGIGIAGIAPKAGLMALRACAQVPKAGGSTTLCDSLGIARALQFAILHKADVINLSLSGPPAILLSKLIGIAIQRNATVVTAFDPSLPDGGFPASMPGVIAVADDALHNLPPSVYAAPSRDIPTTQPGGKWYLVNGTSFAVAHVSGLAALARQRRGRSPLSRNSSGQIDACATVLQTSALCDCSCRTSQLARSARR